MEKKKKIIVAHEGKQHSFRTAEALLQKGYLFKYITTIYDKPRSLTRIVKSLLRGDAKKKCASHRTDALPDSMVVQFCEFEGLLRLFLSKIPSLYKYFPHYYNWLHDRFGRKVAEYAIENNVDAVIMYDTNANSCFKILKDKAPHIKRILDVTIGNRLYTQNVYKYDSSMYADSKILEETALDKISNFSVRLSEELSLSEYFLAGSKYVADSLEYSDVPKDSIKILPYGVNVNAFRIETKLKRSNTLHLIFVGSVSYRKGIHHLLSVASNYNAEDVILDIVGAYSQDSDYYKKYRNCSNIRFVGFVDHNQLARLYQKADIFVLPSLSEGFAQVSLEAMGCGLPVICTTNSGCNDVITDFETGFVIEPSDREALKERIDWFCNHKDLIPSMGLKCRDISQRYTWETYGKKLNIIMDEICQ